MTNAETHEDRIASLEKSERQFRSFRDEVYADYRNYLRDVRNYKTLTNIVLVIVVLLSLMVAPFAVFQCWQTWNGYGVVVIDMNGTTKCNQCYQKGQERNNKWAVRSNCFPAIPFILPVLFLQLITPLRRIVWQQHILAIDQKQKKL